MLNFSPPPLKPSGGRRGGLRTPSQLALEEREDVESTNKKYCESNSHVNAKLWHQVECGPPSYLRDHRHTSK